MLKVGLELYWAEGPDAVRRIAAHAPVFVDAKLHDIPNTVERAAANIARLGVAMLNVHALGGEAMMRAALDGAARGAEQRRAPDAARDRGDRALVDVGGGAGVADLARVRGACTPGSTASSCRVRTSPTVREVCGDGFCLVVPGIRPPGANGDDQVRVLTPSAALDAGADYLVVGRPITAADDPVGVAKGIVLGAR